MLRISATARALRTFTPALLGHASNRAVTVMRLYASSSSKGLLPPQKKEHEGRHTLVLDMDHTLLEAHFEKCKDADAIAKFKVFEVPGKEPPEEKAWVYWRPGAQEFLSFAKEKFEVVVFTNAMQEYADAALDGLDSKKAISYRLYRQHCSGFGKDLSKLGRDLSKVILVDDKAFSYAIQPANAYPIEEYRNGDRTDKALPALQKFLEKEILPAKDVREPLRKFEEVRMGLLQSMGSLTPPQPKPQ